MIKNIVVPALGEGITDVTIIRWLVQPGDVVEVEQPVVEIATDKVDSEIISPFEGEIKELLFDEGDIPKVGEPIIKIITNVPANEEAEEEEIQPELNHLIEDEPKEELFLEEDSKDVVPVENQQAEEEKTRVYATKDRKTDLSTKPFISPFIRTLAAQYNISYSELLTIHGTGNHDRITKEDVLDYLNKRSFGIISKEQKQPTYKSNGNGEHVKKSSAISSTDFGPASLGTMRTEIIQMDRMRRLIAEHMVNSVLTSPHVTSFVEADLTLLVSWRNKVKDEFQRKYNQKLTYTTLIVEAVAKSIKEFPMINVSVDKDKIILKKDINIGMATALQNGNLIVPVIKNADELSLKGIAEGVNELAERARNHKLLPSEVKGGTFTITNLGSFGNITGTPIINQPEVAILAAGALTRKPAVVKTAFGETIGIRDIIIFSLTYDHRVVDGALGGRFLKRIADKLENFDINRKI